MSARADDFRLFRATRQGRVGRVGRVVRVIACVVAREDLAFLAPERGLAPRPGSGGLAWAMLIGAWIVRTSRAVGGLLADAVRWTADHTGVPAVVVAGVGIVLSFRIAKKTARIAVEVSLVIVALLAATHFGWIRF